MQRNSRPSIPDAFPAHGQETVRPVLLRHYSAGKDSSYVFPTPVTTTTKFYNLIDARTDLSTSQTMYTHLPRLYCYCYYLILLLLASNLMIPSGAHKIKNNPGY